MPFGYTSEQDFVDSLTMHFTSAELEQQEFSLRADAKSYERLNKTNEAKTLLYQAALVHAAFLDQKRREAERIRFARENHMVVIDPSKPGYLLQIIDVSPVVQDQAWVKIIVDLLAGIGISIDLDIIKGYKQIVFFRLEDPTGVSSQLIGEGSRIVVTGIELPNGHLAFIWFGSKIPSLTVHTSVANAMLAHGHGLKTQLVYV